MCFESQITDVAPKKLYLAVCGKDFACVCVLFCFVFPLFNLFGLLKWYMLSFPLIKELKTIMNISVDVSDFQGSLSSPFLSTGFLYF